MTITEGNKLIAVFLGYKYYGWNNPDRPAALHHQKGGVWWKEKYSLSNPKGERMLSNPLDFHFNWNHIMMAYKAIEETGIDNTEAKICDRSGHSLGYHATWVKMAILDVNIKKAWEHITGFIELYNKIYENNIDG